MPTTEKIYPEYIHLDGGTQPRSRIDPEVCDDYAERMKAGVEFPPLDVYFDGQEYWLADGFHRLKASVFARPGEPMECNVYQGTLEDAQWHSYGVNKTHGLRRSNRDKEQAVRAALKHPNGVKKSDNQIAKHVGVDHKTVGKYRAELQASREIPKIHTRTATRGTSTYLQDTTNVGKGMAKRNDKRRVTVYSGAQAQEAIEQGRRVRFRSFVKLELPTNHVPNCAHDLLRFFPFDYLQKVFQEIVRINQQHSQKEAS